MERRRSPLVVVAAVGGQTLGMPAGTADRYAKEAGLQEHPSRPRPSPALARYTCSDDPTVVLNRYVEGERIVGLEVPKRLDGQIQAAMGVVSRLPWAVYRTRADLGLLPAKPDSPA